MVKIPLPFSPSLHCSVVLVTVLYLEVDQIEGIINVALCKIRGGGGARAIPISVDGSYGEWYDIVACYCGISGAVAFTRRDESITGGMHW